MVEWASVPEVRRVAGVTTTDFSDAQIQDAIAMSQKEVNSKVLTKITREPVLYIDPFRDNDIDASNTTYYIKNWRGNFFADTNYNNTITTSDVSVIKYVTSTETESELTVSSIDISACSFTLSIAPTSDEKLYVSYGYMPLNPTTPDGFLKQCVIYLAGSYLLLGNEGHEIRFGNVSIKPGKAGGKGEQLYNKYLELISQLNINMTGGTLWSQMAENI